MISTTIFITAIIISAILLCLIILLLFLIYEKVITIGTSNVGGKTYPDGMNYMWYIVSICLFKLYNENSIIDYYSLQESLAENVNILTKDNKKMEEWNKKFLEFMNKEK